MKLQRMICVILAAAMVAGCHYSSDTSVTTTTTHLFRENSLANGRITLRNNVVLLHGRNLPDATISHFGNLSINRHPVTVEPAQRALLEDYYLNAMAARGDTIAVQRNGAAYGGNVLKRMAHTLLTGSPDQATEAKVTNLRQRFVKICQDLSGIESAQDQLAASLPAFRPYADLIKRGAGNDCGSDVAKR